MLLFSIFYNIIIKPIELIIEAVFCFELNKIGAFGVIGAIITVSLVVNLLALPIYNMADAIQKHEHDIQKKLSKGIARIKSVFTGDERFMMLQIFYKQNNYSPIYSLRSSLSILIEIPFFIAAYHFLSNCTALKGASFGFLGNLGLPDSSIKLIGGGYSLNILPIVMTFVNIISATIYLKDSSLRDKIQTYGLAIVFLVLLYNSPSGLVFYWILNNLFSLVKNVIIQYCPKPNIFVYITICVLIIPASLYMVFFSTLHNKLFKVLFIVLVVVLLFLPYILTRVKIIVSRFTSNMDNDNTALFVFASLGTVILVGLFLSSSAISTSPVEFSFVGNTDSPLFYIWNTFTILLGLFLFWPFVIYRMLGKKARLIISYSSVIILFIGLLDALLFAPICGKMDALFRLETTATLRNLSLGYILLPILFTLIVIIFCIFVQRLNLQKYLFLFVAFILLAQITVSFVNIKSIAEKYVLIKKSNVTQKPRDEKNIRPIYHFSKNSKNVVVLFLDSAVGVLLPSIIDQFPIISSSFSGFVGYPNTVSFGSFTVSGSPAMMGGYEYSIENINKRADELLVAKHNEALSVMPKIFLDGGYKVKLTNPPYLNYEWSGDSSPYKKLPGVECSFVNEDYYEPFVKMMRQDGTTFPLMDEAIAKHILGFCLMQITLPIFRTAIYDSKNYLQTPFALSYLGQYSHLYYLKDLFDCNEKSDTFTFIGNDLPHSWGVLDENKFTPNLNANAKNVNTGNYKSQSDEDVQIYQLNSASLLLVSKWLESLKNFGIYNNTRIIIVSDHGRIIGGTSLKSKTIFNPLLLVKDFDASGQLRIDNTFMTNADILFIAKKGLGLADINPFTNKVFNIDKSMPHVYSPLESKSLEYKVLKTKTTFSLGENGIGYSVHDDIFDMNNWAQLNKSIIDKAQK